MGEDQVFKQLQRAVDALERRGGDLEAVRTEQSRQAEEQDRQAVIMGQIKSALDEMKGADVRGQVRQLRQAVLEPHGLVDNLRLESARKTGQAKTWAVIAALLGAIGTVLGILKQVGP